MNSDWVWKSIGDLGKIVTGKTPSTKNADYWNGDIPFVTPKDIQGSKHILSTERTVSANGLKAVHGSILPDSAVCVSCIGNIGYLGITTQTSVSNQQINSVIVNQENDVNFVYYLLKKMWSFFKNYEGQSTALSILNKTQFSKIPVLLPELETQRKIASVLSALDDKIELNMRINDNLADLLHTRYQSCFEHTAKDGESGSLSDICEFSGERIAVSNISIEEYFSTENMLPNKAGVITATTLPTVAQTTRCRKGDTLISNIRPYFKKIYYSCSSDVLCFVPCQTIYSAFLFCTLYADRFFDYMVSGSKGTKMPRGDKQQIMAYSIPIPSNSALRSFNELAIPILTAIGQNSNENKTLSSLRDALLPRLMSGELDVSELDL